jgi:CheY-like chemotaxis protein
MASDRRKGAIVVLVVDDDPAVLRVTAELFRHLGYDVLSAETGYDALDILRSGEQHIDGVAGARADRSRRLTVSLATAR